MNFSDINNVGNRKMLINESEKLREKVSRENAKVIKLKVAQDTAYWELKEKLKQVESNHEKLQQNMVEVQMQHEALSGQYQEELRLRPDTLNKCSSTRAICDVLENYCQGLKDTMSRCKEDQAALGEAFQCSGQLVREAKNTQAEAAKRSQARVEGLEDKIKLMNGHQNQLLQFFTQAKQQAEAEIGDLRNKLTTETAHKEQLIAALNELNRKMDQCKSEIEKKEERNANLQAELKRIMQEFNSQASEARDVLAQQNKEIKEVKEENKSIKQALDNQEQFTKTVGEHKNALQEKVAILEDENVGLVKASAELNKQVEEATNLNQRLQISISELNDEKQNLLQKVQEIQKILLNVEREIKDLELEHSKVEREKADLAAKLDKSVEEFNNKAADMERLTSLKEELENKVEELEAAMKSHRDTSDEKIKELNSLLQTKDHELDSKASAINQMMSELKTSADIRSKLEGALLKIKQEIEMEKAAVKEMEKKMTNTIEQLQNIVRAKDDELSKQMSTIMEIRKEKELLQEKHQSMQNKLHNVQKELTRSPRTERDLPEQDDNAVVLTPARKRTALMQPPSPPSPQPPQPPQFAAPRAALDDMVYQLFSDSSRDSLDSTLVKRRFEKLERGERMSPIPLSALKRRGSVPAAHAARNYTSDKQYTEISQSQVRNDLNNKQRSFFKNKRTRK